MSNTAFSEVGHDLVLYREGLTYFDEPTNLYLSRYMVTEGLALVAVSEEGEFLDDLSVNLADYGISLTEGDVFVPNYSEHAGTMEFLKNAGVVDRVVRSVEFGPYNAGADEIVLKRF